MEMKAEVGLAAAVKKEDASSAKSEDVKENISGAAKSAASAAVKEEVKPTTPTLNPLAKLEQQHQPIGAAPPSTTTKLPFSEVKDKNDNVEVTLTLSADASENVQVSEQRRLGSVCLFSLCLIDFYRQGHPSKLVPIVTIRILRSTEVCK